MLPRRGERYEAGDVERAIAEAWPESETLEYKADPTQDPRRLDLAQKLEIIVARAVSAFANSAGGTLVLGVTETAGQPRVSTPPGLPRTIGRDRADERVEFMVTRCLEPRPACSVHFAEIDQERAYVVVDVAPRGGGPYRITNASDPALNGRYYVRRGRESVPADHFTLRALFADALEEGQRVREYIARQGLADNRDDNPRFGRHDPAHQLAVQPGQRARSALIVTSIPEVLRGEIVDMDRPEVRAVLSPGGRAGWLEERPTLEGRMLFRASNPPLLQSYLHAHRNGYLEAGDARILEEPPSGKRVLADAIAEVFAATLDVAAKLYTAASLRDRIQVDLHLRQVESTRLALRGDGASGYNTQTNLTISELLTIDELGAPATLARFDRRLANAYGLEAGVVLDPDGSRRQIFLAG